MPFQQKLDFNTSTVRPLPAEDLRSRQMLSQWADPDLDVCAGTCHEKTVGVRRSLEIEKYNKLISYNCDIYTFSTTTCVLLYYWWFLTANLGI